MVFNEPSDERKVWLLGPFAWTLTYIMQYSSAKRDDKVTDGETEACEEQNSQMLADYGYYLMAFCTFRGC